MTTRQPQSVQTTELDAYPGLRQLALAFNAIMFEADRRRLTDAEICFQAFVRWAFKKMGFETRPYLDE